MSRLAVIRAEVDAVMSAPVPEYEDLARLHEHAGPHLMYVLKVLDHLAGERSDWELEHFIDCQGCVPDDHFYGDPTPIYCDEYLAHEDPAELESVQRARAEREAREKAERTQRDNMHLFRRW